EPERGQVWLALGEQARLHSSCDDSGDCLEILTPLLAHLALLRVVELVMVLEESTGIAGVLIDLAENIRTDPDQLNIERQLLLHAGSMPRAQVTDQTLMDRIENVGLALEVVIQSGFAEFDGVSHHLHGGAVIAHTVEQLRACLDDLLAAICK